MNDILPSDSILWNRIEAAFRQSVALYGFYEVKTPILEETALFTRSIGDATEIVEKEMYTFEDKGGHNLSLRPEGTASMVRAYIENPETDGEPIARWFYFGPMYRYERPQKGRYREFYQFGAEAFGVAAPEQDAELMAMAVHFLNDIGLKDVTLKLNSLGDSSDREIYKEKLLAHLRGYENELCEDCKRRMTTNPLRVLDCKQEACIAAASKAPLIIDNLGEEAKTHFEKVKHTLDSLGIKYVVDPHIVRGLDYYNRSAFEFITENLGAQKAVGGGGRYDALVEQLGGPATPAVGFAMGVERLIALLKDQGAQSLPSLDFFVIPMGDAALEYSMKLGARLRSEGLSGEVDCSGRRLKNLFKRAERIGARYTIIIGEQELAEGTANVKNMETKEQQRVSLDMLSKETLK